MSVNISKKAFTLVELLVVMSIISFLSSIVLANLNTAREKARINAAREFVASLEHSYSAVIHYSFDDASNLNKDTSGKIGTMGGMTWSSDTPSGTGGSANVAAGDYISYGSKTDSGFRFDDKSFVLSVWIKTDGSNLDSNMYKSARLITTGHCGGGTKGYSIAISTDTSGGNPNPNIQTGLIGENAAFYYTSNEKINILDNKWHHIGVIFDFTNKKSSLYVDGQQIKNITMTTYFGSCTVPVNGYADFSTCNFSYKSENDSQNLLIDGSYCGGQQYKGLMDDVEIMREM